MILSGGRLAPVAPHHASGARPTAIALRDGIIVHLGDEAGARAAAPDEPVIDCAGALITPAFVDAHVHLIQTGLVMDGLDLHGVPSRQALLDAVADHVRTRPEVRIVFGQGWDEREWPEPTPPTRAELDRAAGAVPVYLARVDVHSAVISTALLDRLPDLPGRDGFRSDGWLTRDAHHRARASLDELTPDDQRRTAAESALRVAAGLGVGAVHELGGPHLGPLADLTRAAEAGRATGVRVTGYWGELASENAFARAREVGALGLAGDLCIDGALGSRTAALRHPYADADTQGTRYLDLDAITEHVVACTRMGVQAGFHCIGDDAVSAAVAGLRRAAERLGADAIRRSRHRLEHLELVDRDDLGTLAELGVVASVQPGFDAAWGHPGGLYDQRLGSTRAATMNPLGDLHRTGVPLAFGTDAPVTPLAGWQQVADAVRHSRPDQAMSVADAFAAATIGGHRAAKDDRNGILAVGHPADLALWDGAGGRWDPVSGLPLLDHGEPLPTCRATVVAGRVISGDPGPTR